MWILTSKLVYQTMYLICDVVFDSCNINCGGPLGGEKGEGEFWGGEGQSGTNQGQVWNLHHESQRGISK
jgi:hypothetical protein